MHDFHFCDFCHNARVDFDLDSDHDLSYLPVGKPLEGYSMFIRSGDSKSTSIIVSHNGHDVIFYRPNYCPNCGRYLFENLFAKRKKG